MKKYSNWEIYFPERTENNAMIFDAGAMFLRDSKGNDWYELAHELELLKDKFFVAVDDQTMMVKCYGSDPWGYPLIGSIFCVVDSLPEEFTKTENSHIHFKLVGNKFVPDDSKKIEFLKDYIPEEIQWASSQIAALEDIPLFGTQTILEQERLLALRKYRYEMVRMNPETDVSKTLPERP